jgi:putative glutamine amidotransferase
MSGRSLRILVPSIRSQPRPMRLPHPVAVTATTEVIRGVPRTRANVAYTEAVHAAGLRPYILPILAPGNADAMLDGMGGLVLTGGEDVDPKHFGAARHPALGEVHGERDAFELALVHCAQARRLPVLAICRGVQVANVALGGTLVQDLPSQRPDALPHESGAARDVRVHAVSVTRGSRLGEALGATTVTVNSFHHQAVDRVADGLAVAATAPDAVIEGLEWTRDDWWLVGVQWHPEELVRDAEPWDRALFRAFARAVELGASVGAGSPR